MIPSNRFDPIRRPLMRVLVVLVALGSLAAAGNAELSLRTVRHLTFGTVARSTTTDIEYNDMRAGQFIVEGKKNSHVRLTVAATELANDELEIPLDLSKSRCAFSTDGGTNWTLFSTGEIFQDVKFPNAPGSDPTAIYVRVGGSLTVGSSIARGSYVGGVTLTATYLESDDNDDNDDDD